MIFFLSDYGHRDEFVGVCHAVIAGIAPGEKVVDLTHGISPHDVWGGALALVRAVQYVPDGAVVLAVVDPGVGTDRKAIALRTETLHFVGPDNGLLSPAVQMMGGALEAVVLDSEEHRLPSSGGATFDGRDIFAPAAAFLAGGTPLSDLGSPVSPYELFPMRLPLTGEHPAGGLVCSVLWVDHFGNVQLNASPDDLLEAGIRPGSDVDVVLDNDERTVRWVTAYGDGEEGDLILLTDSYGLLSIARNRGRAADTLVLGPGSAVTLRPAGEGPAGPAGRWSVRL